MESAIHISASGPSVDAVLGELRKICDSSPTATGLADVATEDLLAEVRERMAKEGNVVRIEPFETKATEEPRRNRRGHPAKLTEPQSIEPKQPEPQASSVSSASAHSQAGGGEWDEDQSGPASDVTIDDVKAALNRFSGDHGQMAARKKMEEVGGAPRLIDIPATKYAALVAALAA